MISKISRLKRQKRTSINPKIQKVPQTTAHSPSRSVLLQFPIFNTYQRVIANTIISFFFFFLLRYVVPLVISAVTLTQILIVYLYLYLLFAEL